MKYDPKKIESKWQKYWLSKKTFNASNKSKSPKKFVLTEFPYPSGAGLHMGHMRPFIAGDVVSKYFRLTGYNVMYPMGWDAFGLPAENYAIKNKVHPAVSTKKNVANAKRQLQSWGTGFDWSREINTTDPEYYKWTQKLFLEFFKAGLAYEKFGEINWCPKDKTGLANEEVVDGKCERCGTVVEKKNLRQWYLKITDYAEKLLNGLENLPDWPESVKLQQANWIGKSEGAEISFRWKVEGGKSEGEIKVFTTRVDTIFSGTFLILSPEHKAIVELKDYISNYDEVQKYLESVKGKTDAERTDKKNKDGVELKGVSMINPATGQEMPVWVSDFVIGSYGTGAVFADAHDKRDFDMAKKYNIPLKVSILPKGESDEILNNKILNLEECYEEEGILFNSMQFDGLASGEARPKIIDWLESKGLAEKRVNYKLRDWVFSRQRYWGEPIPLIHCEKCGIVAVPEKDLPVKLPNVKNYEPTGTGESPLAGIESWVKTPCPKCIEDAKKTKYLVFDFDGVIGDTYEAGLKARMSVGWSTDMEDSVKKTFEYFSERPSHANGHSYTKEELAELLKKSREFGLVIKESGVKIFSNFVSEIKKIKNCKIAVVSSGCKIYVDIGVKKSGLKIDSYLTLDDSFSKEDKLNVIAKKWKVNLKDLYYFTDANCDVYELENILDRKKIIGCSWGYLGYDELLKTLPENQILKRPKDIHDIFKPRIGRRETNTMPQWAGSSWYWLRYMDPKNKKEFASLGAQKYWSPVDLYFGGMEHTTLHLLYSRFWNLVFKDRGLVAVSEPYKKRVPHGIILGPDGEKMSKSRGNVVNPDDIVKIYGADTVRLYMMFLGPHGASVSWNDKGIVGARRFVERIFNLPNLVLKKEDAEVTKTLHKTIKKITEDLETFSFNTAVSAMMIFVNKVHEIGGLTKSSLEKFLIIVSPFIPHVIEEVWKNIGNNKSVFMEKWPKYDARLIVDTEVNIVIQVNGKLRGQIRVNTGLSEESVLLLAKSEPKVSEYLAGQEVKKAIYIKDKLVNFVV